jgi:predicted transcriptional regulator
MSGKDRRGAGELADEVLGILQAAGEPLLPADVRERLSGDLAYTTVVTILSRLHAKGVLDRERAGRAYRYRPVADEPGLAARRMASVLAGEADREAVLARFVSGLSGEDERALRRMLGETDGASGAAVAGEVGGAAGAGEISGAAGAGEAGGAERWS